MSTRKETAVLRIVDANCNRLREALRVIEEHFRFIVENSDATVRVKKIRHAVSSLEKQIDYRALLDSRDSAADPLRSGSSETERTRLGTESVAVASVKRGQEAARVLEEYLKLTDTPALSDEAKQIRFSLYEFEKEYMNR